MNFITSFLKSFLNNNTITISGELITGENIKINKFIRIDGKVILSDSVIIEDNCSLKNCKVGTNTIIKKGSIVNDCIIGSDVAVGPYARIRPDSNIGNKSQIGNFVEIKNSIIGQNTKINHLAYIGDSKIGDDVIIGAGVVTCNFDGAKNNKTIIENNSFIGSGVYLVAPVNIGNYSTIGSGSVITSDVKSGELVIARSRQVTIEGWERPSPNKKN